jgi:hypothetical protein
MGCRVTDDGRAMNAQTWRLPDAKQSICTSSRTTNDRPVVYFSGLLEQRRPDNSFSIEEQV